MKRAYVVKRSRAAGWARLCGGLAVPVLVLAAVGARAGLIPSPALLPALIVGFLLGLAALAIAVYALIDIWKSGAEGTGSAVAGIVYALPALSVLGLIAVAAIAYPRLADVSTDLDDPPELTGARSVISRQVAASQAAAYPDLVTRTYPVPLGEVYAATRDIVEERGWTIVRDERPTIMPESLPSAAAPTEGGESDELLRVLAEKSVMTQSRGASAAGPTGEGDHTEFGESNIALLEATAPTPVFGFVDKVAVRLRGTPEGTEVDVRSASTIGAHDLGQNARRIRSLLEGLDDKIQPRTNESPSWLAAFGL